MSESRRVGRHARARRLAEDRCQRRGHLLAWVEARGDARFVLWRSAETHMRDGRVYRDKKAVTTVALTAEEAAVTPQLHAVATCPCGDDHSVDLADLARRALTDPGPVMRPRIRR